VQLLLGHIKLESTVRYLGIEVDDVLTISEQVELYPSTGLRSCELRAAACGLVAICPVAAIP
jgi:hypothetical protein